MPPSLPLDVRSAVRSLMRRKASTAAVVAAIALAIGASHNQILNRTFRQVPRPRSYPRVK